MFHVLSPVNDSIYATVANITVCGELLHVTCFVRTGQLFINGKPAVCHKTVRETIEWYLGESLNNYKIEDLYFQNGNSVPRYAHTWELKTFYTSHWRYYAKNNIRISATIVSSFYIV